MGVDAIQDIFQAESVRVLAALMGHLRDLELAEDCLQDALVAALTRWPFEGVPRSPAAWLITVARNRALDRLRRERRFDRSEAGVWALENAHTPEDSAMTTPDDIPDERLKLMFTCCHPALAKDVQVALTLHTLGGLSAAEIAAAFLIPVATMQQRLVRAKRKIRDAGIPYQVPSAHAISERLDAVLSVIYLIFNAGYLAASGDGLMRHDLCGEAIRLAAVLCGLLSREPALGDDSEALGLWALMLLHDSRRDARTSQDGDIILLEDQDRLRWNRAQIDEGVRGLDRALALRKPGVYQIQAAIAALHAQALTAEDTDWRQITLLYDSLYRSQPSPVVALNRAVAVSMVDGAERGLLMLDALVGLDDYYLYHAARAELLRRLGILDSAREAYHTAYGLCPNRAGRAYLARRMAECA